MIYLHVNQIMYCNVACFFSSYAYRKLLKEDQLEAGTKAAQQEEMERRKRLEQQRKDFPTPVPAVPDTQLGDCLSFSVMWPCSHSHILCNTLASTTFSP